MNASSEQIEREVEASRANVEDTVEALKDKMSVGQIVDEAARYLRNSGGGDMVSNLGAQVRDNPIPLALVGVGLAWLMSGRGQPHLRSSGGGSRSDRNYRSYGSDYETLDEDEYRRAFGGESSVYSGSSHPDYSRRSTGLDDSWPEGERTSDDGRSWRDRAGSAYHGAGDAASGVTGAVGSAASAIAGAVGSAASSIGSAASRAGHSAYSAAGSAAGGARSGAGAAWRGGSRFGSSAYERASGLHEGAYDGASRLGRRAQRGFSDVLETEPLVLGALGIAVGAAIGAMLPRTSTEDRYMGDYRDHFRDDVEAYAREQFERGKAVAEEAYRAARSEADAQGLTTTGEDSVAHRVGEVARATMNKARESADEQGLTGGSGGTSSSSSSSGGSSGGSSGSSSGSGSSYAGAGGTSGSGTGGGATSGAGAGTGTAPGSSYGSSDATRSGTGTGGSGGGGSQSR